MPPHQDADLSLAPGPPHQDLYSSDAALVATVRLHGAEQHSGRLSDLGSLAGAARSTRWAEFVDRYPPTLRTHDGYGRRVDEVEYHPAWHRLLQTAVRAGLTAPAWHRERAVAPHTARAAALAVWSQTEVGHLLGLTTTYAAAPALHADEAVAQVWLPRLASRAYESGLRPARDKLGSLCGLALTERAGGSDLQTLSTVARPEPGGPLECGQTYRLTGQKWFCTAPMSDVFLVLAQAPEGPTCFLVPRVLDDGTLNTWHLTRLKNKVGTRAGASAEIELDGTWATRLGDPGRGSRTLVGTAAALRLDAVMISVGVMRFALVRAVHHARHRVLNGSPVATRPLMQNVLADLALEYEAALALGMRMAAAVDAGETDLLRVGVPVAKYWVAKRTPAVVAEAMECVGNYAYVEDHALARMYRDAPGVAMAEGTGNLNALDVLRATAVQPRAMEALLAEIDRARGADPRLDEAMDDVAGFVQAAGREARRDPEAVEAGARWMVERLAVVLQASLLIRQAPSDVASAFVETRIAGGGGQLFGTLPIGRRTTQAIVDRALPV